MASFFKDRKKILKCSHCEGTSHTVDRCFQIIGYPPGWKGPRGLSKKTETHSHSASQVGASEGEVVSNPLFNQELFEQFMSFTKKN